MVKICRLTVSLMLLSVIFFHVDLIQAKEKLPKAKNNDLQNELFANPFLPTGQSLQFCLANAESSLIQTGQIDGSKSAKLGMLFSAIVPGSGEIYAKSWLKGALFLGVEIGSWFGYANYYSKGKDLEKQYLQYADNHWSKEDWLSWWNSLSTEAQERWAHHELPETKTQQYYEMIGKYQKYNAGWDDAQSEIDTSQHSLYYMDLRGQSNDKLKIATTFTAIVLANHVLSAIDAVWSVNQFNKRLKPSLGVDYIMLNDKPQLVANFSLRW